MISKELTKIASILASIKLANDKEDVKRRLKDYAFYVEKLVKKEFPGAKFTVDYDPMFNNISFETNKRESFIVISGSSKVDGEYTVKVNMGSTAWNDFDNPRKEEILKYVEHYLKETKNNSNDKEEWERKLGIENFDKGDLIKEILDFAKTLQLTPDDTDIDSVTFSTRDHGDVGEEKASPIDVKIMKDYAAKFKAKFPKIRASIEVIDEWVNLTIRV